MQFIPVSTVNNINNALVPMHSEIILNKNMHASSILVLLLKERSGYRLICMIQAVLSVLHVFPLSFELHVTYYTDIKHTDQ